MSGRWAGRIGCIAASMPPDQTCTPSKLRRSRIMLGQTANRAQCECGCVTRLQTIRRGRPELPALVPQRCVALVWRAGNSGLPLRVSSEVVGYLLHLREPDPVVLQQVIDCPFEHSYSMWAADDLRVHRQHVADVAALPVHPGEV